MTLGLGSVRLCEVLAAGVMSSRRGGPERQEKGADSKPTPFDVKFYL